MPRMHQKYGERSDAADRVQVRRCSRAQTLIVRLLQELLKLGHSYLFGKSTLFGRSASWEEPARQFLPKFLGLRPGWTWPYLPAEHPLPDEAVIKSVENRDFERTQEIGQTVLQDCIGRHIAVEIVLGPAKLSRRRRLCRLRRSYSALRSPECAVS